MFRVDSRLALSLWLCEQHNEVNEKLGKKIFPCKIEMLDQRWKKGAPGCWNYIEPEEEEDESRASDKSS